MLTGGRIVLGVGGGASVGGIAAMGGIRRTGSEMIAFTDEALQFMRTALAGGVVTFRSEPAHDRGLRSRAGVSVAGAARLGSNGPRMLAVTGRSSDGWVSPLEHVCRSDGRPLSTTADRRRGALGRARPGGRAPDLQRGRRDRRGTSRTRADGDVESWVAALTDWSVDLGFDTFIFWPMTAPLAQLEVFATQVVPGVRQRVSERRGQP